MKHIGSIRIVFLSLLLPLLTGCAMITHRCCNEPMQPNTPHSNTGCYPQADYVLSSEPGAGYPNYIPWSRGVWTYLPAKHNTLPHTAILLLHEIPGATPACFNLARQMADEIGCRVYVPILFGSPGQNNFLDGLGEELFDADWAGTFLSEHHTPDIVKKLRVLKNQLSAQEKITKWGVVGMCMTGSFPLAFAENPDVKAIVLAQPATPAVYLTPSGASSLGLSPEDIENVAKSNAHVFYIRFAKDKVSAPMRLTTVQNLIQKDRFKRKIICEYGPYITWDAHNTLTYPRNLYDCHNPINRDVHCLMGLLRTWLSD